MKPLFLILLGLAWVHACTNHPSTMEDKALRRLPQALEKAFARDFSASDVSVSDLHTIYVCDSLCMIHCLATAKTQSGPDLHFPVRHVFLRDNLLSGVKGRIVYAEVVSGAPYLSAEEIEMLKRSCAENGKQMYIHYSSAADPIEEEIQ